jgi:hypothetical protein
MDADGTVMPLLPRHKPAWLALLAIALLAGGCGGVQASAPGKLSAEQTEAFLERSGEGQGMDYECAAASGAWDYECVFTRDGQRFKIGVKVNSEQATASSGYIPADMSFEEAEKASKEAIDARWYADVRELCAGVVRDRATFPKPDTFENTKSYFAGVYALSARFRDELSSLRPPEQERARVDRVVALLGEDVEDARKLYDAVAQKDQATADRLLRELQDRGREEAEILASFGC